MRDKDKNCFITISPVWFNPYTANSLASWIIYYLERAMWIHFKL